MAAAGVALALLASACSTVDDLASLRDRASEAGDTVGEFADRTRFCFAVTRALAGMDGDRAPERQREAAEEVLAQVPDELRGEAEQVASTLRRAAEERDPSLLDDPEFQRAAEDLRDGTRRLCDPR